MTTNHTPTRPCIVCWTDTRKDSGRCTNRCCANCHARFCTTGGATSPGHGLNLPAARIALAAEATAKSRRRPNSELNNTLSQLAQGWKNPA